MSLSIYNLYSAGRGIKGALGFSSLPHGMAKKFVQGKLQNSRIQTSPALLRKATSFVLTRAASGVTEGLYGPLGHLALSEKSVTYRLNNNPTNLLSHTNTGLQLTRWGLYEKAAGFFQDKELASETGIGVDLQPVTFNNYPSTPEQLVGLYKAIDRSYFNHELGNVVLPTPSFSCEPRGRGERNMQKAIYYHEAMRGLEEWLHASQISFNTLVSSAMHNIDVGNGNLYEYISLGNFNDERNPLEDDIAYVFLENGIPVTSDFIGEYKRNERVNGIERIKKSPFPPRKIVS